MKNRKHDIERYLRGELTPGEMHNLEKEALNDPFLAEALEGIEQAGRDNFLYDLRHLNKSVHDRARNRKRKPVIMWGWTAGMAAAVLLVAVSGFLVVSLLKDQQSQNQAINKAPSPAPERVVPTDSLDVGTDPAPTPQAEKPEGSASAAGPNDAPGEGNRTPEQNATTESTTGANDLLAERDEDRPSNRAGTRDDETPEENVKTEIEEAETGPLALADTPQAPDIRAESEITTEAVAKKLKGQAAGAEAKRETAAIARSLTSESVLLKGKVISASDGAVLPGVNVLIKGTNIGAVTDTQGNYQLHVPTDSATLAFFFIGFQPLEMTVTKKEELNVALQEDITSLSEVVVTGTDESPIDNDKPLIFRLAEAEGGRSAFKDYLDEAVKYPEEALTNKVEGRVTVRFTVQPDGQLTGFEILKGIGYGCDEELIRAIKAGPAWEPSSRGGVPLADEVKVRFRFQLPE